MDALWLTGCVAPQYQPNRLHLTDCRSTDTVKGRSLCREPSVPHCSLILFTRFNFIEEITMSDAALNQEKEQLLDDVRQVLSSTEDLLGAAGDEGGEKGRELRKRLAENIRLAKSRLLEAEKVVVGKAKVAAKATDDYVHENPWKSIGIAAGVGFLLGMLVSRR